MGIAHWVIPRGDSMISTFHIPQKYSEKFQKIGKSWHGGIKQIFRQTWKFELAELNIF